MLYEVITCLAFFVLPAAVVPASYLGRKIKDFTRRGQATMGNLTSVLQETFAGIKVIKAFGTEQLEGRKFKTENLAFFRFMKKIV